MLPDNFDNLDWDNPKPHRIEYAQALLIGWLQHLSWLQYNDTGKFWPIGASYLSSAGWSVNKLIAAICFPHENGGSCLFPTEAVNALLTWMQRFSLYHCFPLLLDPNLVLNGSLSYSRWHNNNFAGGIWYGGSVDLTNPNYIDGFPGIAYITSRSAYAEYIYPNYGGELDETSSPKWIAQNIMPGWLTMGDNRIIKLYKQMHSMFNSIGLLNCTTYTKGTFTLDADGTFTPSDDFEGIIVFSGIQNGSGSSGDDENDGTLSEAYSSAMDAKSASTPSFGFGGNSGGQITEMDRTIGGDITEQYPYGWDENGNVTSWQSYTYHVTNRYNVSVSSTELRIYARFKKPQGIDDSCPIKLPKGMNFYLVLVPSAAEYTYQGLEHYAYASNFGLEPWKFQVALTLYIPFDGTLVNAQLGDCTSNNGLPAPINLDGNPGDRVTSVNGSSVPTSSWLIQPVF